MKDKGRGGRKDDGNREGCMILKAVTSARRVNVIIIPADVNPFSIVRGKVEAREAGGHQVVPS